MAGTLIMAVNEAEASLKHAIASRFGEPLPPVGEAEDVQLMLRKFRNACLVIMGTDVSMAKSQNVDQRLWLSHTRVYGKFKAEISKQHAAQQGNKSVAWRKSLADYLIFIKDSQSFYRSLLRSLSDKHPASEGLLKVANRLRSQAPLPARPERAIQHPDHIKTALDDICCETLVHLGDLSRWRTVIQPDAAAGGFRTATGYYDLASELYPQSGIPYHQLAVLTLANRNNFKALLYFYLSLTRQVPHPEAARNLSLLVKKLKGYTIANLANTLGPAGKSASIATLRAWFVRLHTEAFEGNDSIQRMEMEKEVITRVGMVLSSGADATSTLLSISLIAIAAEYLNFSESLGSNRSNDSFHRLNLRILVELLRYVADAVDNEFREDVTSGETRPAESRIPAIVKVILPPLRVHIIWFYQNSAKLTASMRQNIPDIETTGVVHEAFAKLTSVVNTLLANYPVYDTPAAPDSGHALQEEELISGFIPLANEHTTLVWQKERLVGSKDGKRVKSDKPEWFDHMVRIRDIITWAVRIACEENSPLALDNGRIAFKQSNQPFDLDTAPAAERPHSDVSALDGGTKAAAAATASAAIHMPTPAQMPTPVHDQAALATRTPLHTKAELNWGFTPPPMTHSAYRPQDTAYPTPNAPSGRQTVTTGGTTLADGFHGHWDSFNALRNKLPQKKQFWHTDKRPQLGKTEENTSNRR
ncbi:hypothetical protein EJ06DRAFT_560217 [Trichodelitschia bisporula]|uniref:DNA/RNA-binding domain-containing protein n=1 Tax=Trichodelitschia bisporula TaxID=703511 RepID=A0A6G1HJC0_9PEZI|nr:hypothetical protein EJ06DRAFT_560217 [Trichodelitschia bisporula]